MVLHFKNLLEILDPAGAKTGYCHSICAPVWAEILNLTYMKSRCPSPGSLVGYCWPVSFRFVAFIGNANSQI